MDNASIVKVFTLSGLDEIMDHRVTIFFLTLLCYCMIILVNVTVIVIIVMDENLHEPMYILLCNLCINGLFGTAGFYPKFLLDLLSHHHSISYVGCLLQTLVLYSSLCIDICFLSGMAYDRYVAICRPLDYHSVMTKQRLVQIISFSWLVPCGLASISIIFSSRLRLCGSHIQKLYCASWLLAKLSCVPTSWMTSTLPTNVVAYVVMLFYCSHGIFIVCSYVHLINSCLKSLENRGKFIKTCLPHLLALFNITFAALFDVMFMRYGSKDLSQSLQNFMAIEMVVVPPLFNPLIYGLTLTQIRNRIMNACYQKKL